MRKRVTHVDRGVPPERENDKDISSLFLEAATCRLVNQQDFSQCAETCWSTDNLFTLSRPSWASLYKLSGPIRLLWERQSADLCLGAPVLWLNPPLKSAYDLPLNEYICSVFPSPRAIASKLLSDFNSSPGCHF